MFKYIKRLLGINPGLRFDRIRGFGALSCADCGHSQEITAFVHGRDWANPGYQCQACGVFGSDRKAMASPCRCGGLLARNRVLFCPSCRSKRVSYCMHYMT